MIKSGIYKLISKHSEEFYIGSSQNLRKRELDHYSLLRNNKHPNRYLQNVWNKYSDIYFEIVEECLIDNLIVREQYYIDTLLPKYNLRPIAESNKGWKMSEKAKLKLSIANKGKTISEEHKKAISEKNKILRTGVRLSEEHIEAIRKVRTGWSLSEDTRDKIRQKAMGRDKGKILTQETKDKIGLAFSKTVLQYTLDDIYVNEYISASEAARQLNIANSSISSCCRNIRSTAGGFKWKYKNE